MGSSLTKRDTLIDFLRGVAILLVLFLHYYLAYRMPLMKTLSINGNYGVTIFFVISGFLITSTSLARFGSLSNLSLRKFYSFRFARIIPNITLMVSFVLALGWAGISIFKNSPASVPMSETILSIATFSHNIFMQKYGYFNYCLNILWSLSVEEIFYLSFPLLCILIRKETFLIFAWIFLIIYAPFYRSKHQSDEIIALYDYLSCFDGIAIGCLVGVLSRKRMLTQNTSRYVAAASMGVMVFTYFYDGIMENVVLGVSIMGLATGALVFSFQHQRWVESVNKLRWIRAVAWFGKNSYELYLFHVVILALMRTVIGRKEINEYFKPLWFVLYMILSAIIAELISRYYSEPLNRKIRQAMK